MNATIDATRAHTVAMPMLETTSPTCITTTLYDLISAIQSLVESNDDLVVPLVQRLLDSGCVTWGAKLATDRV